jgi:hypothetical protein
VGLFGRRGGGRRRSGRPEADAYHAYDEDRDAAITGDVFDVPEAWGPYDESEAPDDGVPRLDLGCVRMPVPADSQLQVEVDPSGPVRAVHVVTPSGQVTVSAYAAPRSGGLWREVCGELAGELREQGAVVRSSAGAWGQELVAAMNDLTLRFIGVDGPRWMLRGVVAGPAHLAEQATATLHELIGGTVVVRGTAPMPVRTPLTIQLPPAIAEHIQRTDQGQQQPY